MWIMASFGVLMPAIRPPHTVPKDDSRTLQIRSRRAKDLDILRAQYMQGKLGPTIYTPNFDYEYRAYCEPSDFGWALFQMAEEIDYKKFKPTTEDKYADHELHQLYNAIWSTMYGRFGHKGGWSSYTPARPTPYTPATNSRVPSPGKGAGKKGKKNTVEVKHYSTIRPADEVDDVTRWRDPAGGTGWPLTQNPPGLYRSDAARDEYEPDVLDEVDRLLKDNDAVVDAVVEGDVVTYTPESLIDRAWAEIDAIIASENDWFNHTKCDHGVSKKADDACEREFRSKNNHRIAELRELIYEYEKSLGTAHTGSDLVPVGKQ